MKFKVKLKHLWFKLTKPFRTFVFIHERTKIRVRQFPWKFEVNRVRSLQERIDSEEKWIHLESATYIIEHQ